MYYNNVLVITDNTYLLTKFNEIVIEKASAEVNVSYKCSESSTDMFQSLPNDIEINPINIKNETDSILATYDLVISLHCKQLFPEKLVGHVKCINIHPGLNPYNRGWYPQIFAIINKMPHGATIHEIDEKLDHGPIIDQSEVEIYRWDTSLSVYNRVVATELELVRKNIGSILANDYVAKKPGQEGNLNLIRDFKDLCKFDLDESGTFADFYDRLRALSHGEFNNAYFIDSDGNKIFIRLHVEVEK